MPRRKKQSDLEILVELFVDGLKGLGWLIYYLFKFLSWVLKLLFKKTKRDPNSHQASTTKPTWNPPWEAKPKVVRQNWNLTLLNELEWKRFEEVVSEYYTLLGYRSEVTRMGADGGVDVILYQQGVETPAIIVQCKSWSQKVGVKAIRELFGVMAADQIGYGVFATTSSYTQEAIDWADGKRLQLLSGEDLVSAFNQLPEDQRTYLLQFATFEDYSTPTCPSCNKKMVKRTASKGKSAGSSFWGCSNYPRCKQTFKLV
tara:strand:+ start:1819 stop:2592 length:774 start_codon:yes stop_codon:yes gene_type:complete